MPATPIFAADHKRARRGHCYAYYMLDYYAYGVYIYARYARQEYARRC